MHCCGNYRVTENMKTNMLAVNLSQYSHVNVHFHNNYNNIKLV